MKMTEEQRKLFESLTPLQQEISINSIKGMNDIDSYKNSSGKAKTENAMKASASQILTNLNVKLFIDSMKESAVTEAVMSREEMLLSLSNLCRTSISDLIEFSTFDARDDEGRLIKQSAWSFKDSDELTPELLSSIEEVSTGKDGLKIKKVSKLACLKQLAELAGYNSAQKVEHDINSTVTTIDITSSPEEAAKAYAQIMEGK